MSSPTKVERNVAVVRLRRGGMSFLAIADAFGVSVARAEQIVQREQRRERARRLRARDTLRTTLAEKAAVAASVVVVAEPRAQAVVVRRPTLPRCVCGAFRGDHAGGEGACASTGCPGWFERGL